MCAGSHRSILGIFVCVRVQLVFVTCLEVSIRWANLVSRVFWHNPRKKTAQSLVDRGGGIEDSQHCIDITQGQEEKIPET